MRDERVRQTEAIAHDGRPTYEPPRVLRLGELDAGVGTAVCGPVGSGTAGDCKTGNGAGVACERHGNSPGLACYGNGNGD